MDQRASAPLVRFGGSSARLHLAPTLAVCSSSASSCPCCWWYSATGRSCWRCEQCRGGWAHEGHDLWPQLKETVHILHFFLGRGGGESAGRRGRRWAQGNPCPSDGGLHGGGVPAVLDAVRDRGDARVLRSPWSGTTYCQFNSLPVGKDQHGPQPCHICATQPPGSVGHITFTNKFNQRPVLNLT